MPKLLFARSPRDPEEERQVRKLAGARHAPGDWIRRARMITLSWQGQRTTMIAATLNCHPQTVRERLVRFNAEGLAGLGDRPGAGRKRRLTERERGVVIAMARSTPPGKAVRRSDGEVDPGHPDKEAHWSLDALTAAARQRGVAIARSQVCRILTKEGVRWRRTHTWGTSEDPAFAPKGHESSPSTPARRLARRPSVSTNSAP
jgi:transposase